MRVSEGMTTDVEFIDAGMTVQDGTCMPGSSVCTGLGADTPMIYERHHRPSLEEGRGAPAYPRA